MPAGQCSYREAMERLRFILDKTKLELPIFGTSNKNDLHESQMESNASTEDKNIPSYNELLAVVKQQDCYIVQLENENKFCKDELFNMKNVIEDTVIENYQIHEEFQDLNLKMIELELLSFSQQLKPQESPETITSNVKDQMFSKLNDVHELFELPVRDKASPVKHDNSKWLKELETIKSLHLAKTARLETQLDFTKSELGKCEIEIENLKTKLSKQSFAQNESQGCSNCLKRGTDLNQPNYAGLLQERDELQLLLKHKVQQVTELQNREEESLKQVKKSIELAEEAHLEKTQAVHKKEQLEDELNRIKKRMNETIEGYEKKLNEAMNQLKTESDQETKALSEKIQRLSDSQVSTQNHLDKVSREKQSLTTELEHARSQLNNFNIELSKVTESLKSEMLQTMIERDQVLNEYNQFKFTCEKKLLDKEQENIRFSVELAALRQRFEHTEWELMHSKEQCIHLTENILKLEKELSSCQIAKESLMRNKSLDIQSLSEKSELRETELLSLLQKLQVEHAEAICEMEKILNSQTSLINRLREECNKLTEKLESVIMESKSEIAHLVNEYNSLKLLFNQNLIKQQSLEAECATGAHLQEELSTRLEQFENQNDKLNQQVQLLLAKQEVLKNERHMIIQKLNLVDTDSPPYLTSEVLM